MAERVLSVVVPLYNEADNVDVLVERTTQALDKTEGASELILVDDGSTDRTLEFIKEAATRDRRIRWCSLRRRFGKGAALAAGVARATGERIVTMDADLQEDPAEIPKLLEALDGGLELVTGRRRNRRDTWFKNSSSELFNGLIRWITPLDTRDINCGFKAMTRAVADELLLTGGRFRFIPLMAHWWGYKVGEVDVAHQPRERGRSNFGGERVFGALIDLLTVICLVRFHHRPGFLFVASGSASGSLGFLVCFYILCVFLKHGDIQSRHPLLALGVLLLVIGVQLVATGFLAEWFAYRHRDGGHRGNGGRGGHVAADYRVREESARGK